MQVGHGAAVQHGSGGGDGAAVDWRERSWDEVLVEEAETAASQGLGRVAWTRSMRRMFILAAQCLLHKEPVLLVGGTGLGKTTVCQVSLAAPHTLAQHSAAQQLQEQRMSVGTAEPVL